MNLMKSDSIPGDPGQGFTWRGVRFDRNTDRRNNCSVDFTVGEVGGRWWVHPYEVRAPGPYGGLTGIIKWIAHTPIDVPGPSGCIGGHNEGHGDTPLESLEDALANAEKQAGKVAIELIEVMALINQLKDAA
jgi:hypothetical protein